MKNFWRETKEDFKAIEKKTVEFTLIITNNLILLYILYQIQDLHI
jgi:hypothetical protein